MSAESSLDAAGVAQREFTSVRRGCDPAEVRAFLREVAERLEDLERREAAQRERADQAERLDEHRLIELVGEETARVLDAARDAAGEIRRKARESAARVVQEGQDERQRIVAEAEAEAAGRKVEILAEAEALRGEAEVELERRRAEGERLAEDIRREAEAERDRLVADGEQARRQGEADAEQIRDRARQEGEQLVAEAQTARERVLGDLARRRRATRQQLERLNAARERLLAAYAVVRRTIDEATQELTVALPEAKVAGESALRRAQDEPEATIEELEAELSAARLAGLLHPAEVPAFDPGSGGAQSRDEVPADEGGTNAAAERGDAPDESGPRLGSPHAEGALDEAPGMPAGPREAERADPDARRDAPPPPGPAGPAEEPGRRRGRWPFRRRSSTPQEPAPVGGDVGEQPEAVDAVASQPAAVVGGPADPAVDVPRADAPGVVDGPPAGTAVAAELSIQTREADGAGSPNLRVGGEPSVDRAAGDEPEGEEPEVSASQAASAEQRSAGEEPALVDRRAEAIGSIRDQRPGAGGRAILDEDDAAPGAAGEQSLSAEVSEVENGGASRVPPSPGDVSPVRGVPPADDEPFTEVPPAVDEALAAEAPSAEDRTFTAVSPSGGDAPVEEEAPPADHEAPVPETTTPAGSTQPGAAASPRPKVDELFARIKAQQDGAPASGGQPDAPQDTAGAAPTSSTMAVPGRGAAAAAPEEPEAPLGEVPAGDEAGPEAAEVDVSPPERATPPDDDAVWLRERDAVLAGVETTLARRLKRVLADEQNEVLDLLRQARQASLEELVPALPGHVGRYAQAARSELEAAAAHGAARVGGESTAPGQELARALGESVVVGLRERIDRSLQECGDDLDEVTGRLRALYREWKRQRIGEAVRHATAAAYAAGTYAALPRGAEVRWLLDRSHDACPDAEDNALARGVRKGEPFPTGDRCAPAHPGCRCLVVPIGRPPATRNVPVSL